MTLDPSFFADPSQSWPVTVDPAVNLSLYLDTTVDSSTPGVGYGSATTLRSGLFSSTGGIARAYIGFDRTAIAGKHIFTASLSLYETWAPSCTASQLDAYSVQSLPQGTLTWTNQPQQGSLYATVTAAKGYSGSCPAGPVALESGGANGATLASLVQAWANGTSPPALVEVRAHDESDSNGAKVFTSSEGGANGPVLHVVYNSYPAVPTNLSTGGEEDGTIVLHGTFTDPDPWAIGHVEYTISQAGQAVLTGSGPDVSSGQDSPYVVPDGALEQGAAYTWVARAFDGIDHSPDSAQQVLLWDQCESPGTSNATESNIVYKVFHKNPPTEVPPTPIYLDEYDPTPLPAGTSAPAVVLIHGGGWFGGCRENLDSEATTLAGAGFIAFTVDWRLACAEDVQGYSQEVSSLCGWPWQKEAWETGQPHAAVQDVQDAIAWIKANASSYWPWNGKLAALGSSAGAAVLLEAIASAPPEDQPLVDASATWSAKMEFATFDTPPTDGFASKDTCDHSHFPDPHNPNDRDRAPGCWFGVDSYLDSFNADRVPDCGFENGQVNRDSTDIDPSDPEHACDSKWRDWVDASPRVSWACQCADAFGPVFVANGGGTDPNDAMQAETVPLEEAREFHGVLVQNLWLPEDAVLCEVNTTQHATGYENLPCNDGNPNTVLGRTITFFIDHLTT